MGLAETITHGLLNSEDEAWVGGGDISTCEK